MVFEQKLILIHTILETKFPVKRGAKRNKLISICCTLRSGLHEIPTIISTFLHGLKNNHDNFTRKAYICIIPGKLSENNLHAWLFSNPYGHVLKSIKSRGQIRPILLRRKRAFPHGLENNNKCKWILDNFSGLISMSAFL